MALLLNQQQTEMHENTRAVHSATACQPGQQSAACTHCEDVKVHIESAQQIKFLKSSDWICCTIVSFTAVLRFCCSSSPLTLIKNCRVFGEGMVNDHWGETFHGQSNSLVGSTRGTIKPADHAGNVTADNFPRVEYKSSLKSESEVSVCSVICTLRVNTQSNVRRRHNVRCLAVSDSTGPPFTGTC